MKANVDGTTYREKRRIAPSQTSMPTTSALTTLFKHGSIHSITDANAVCEKLVRVKKAKQKVLEDLSEHDIDSLSKIIAGMEKRFFFNLVSPPYNLNSALISHISLFERGRVFSHPSEEINPNKSFPTFLTFVGQFIDHDLTLNMIDLIGRAGNFARTDDPDNPVDETIGDNGKNPNEASPFIDLDSVYGMRDVLVGGHDPANPDDDIWNIIDKQTGKFFLRYNEEGKFFDFCRIVSNDENNETAFIFDKRNDENQIISQIHLLIIRLHNILASDSENFPPPIPDDEASVMAFVNQVRTEVVRTWQSVIWNEYLPKLINPDTLKEAIAAARAAAKPTGMPHEFSISFRMGHSQLRPSYKLNRDNLSSIPLFDNQVFPITDLRGGRPLQKTHVIEWNFFLDEAKSKQTSNKVDSKVTSVVFNLPESAIPDNVKGVVNLPQRNLMRSEQVKLASGEDVAEFYKVPAAKTLTPDDIEPDSSNQKLFELEDNGSYNEIKPHDFRTPLWYYVLKEAELLEGGKQLGPVGGRIIGEVIAAAVWHQDYSFNNPDVSSAWKAIIKDKSTDVIMFKDIVDYVLKYEDPTKTPMCSV